MTGQDHRRGVSAMLSFLFKKENQIELLIFEYLENLKLAQNSFRGAINACMLSGSRCEDFGFQIRQTHKYESKADDIREEINNLMYSKALIPDSRGDILRLMEAMDKIPALFEHVLFIIQTQQIDIPDFIIPDMEELVRISLECCDLMGRQAFALFKKTEGIRMLMSTIDTNESRCDHIERSIITKVFASELAPFDKLQLKDLIIKIGEISDQADRVSRQINIFTLKRRL
jgi:predicted phosphate transport protein (TIGR00153 family)